MGTTSIAVRVIGALLRECGFIGFDVLAEGDAIQIEVTGSDCVYDHACKIAAHLMNAGITEVRIRQAGNGVLLIITED